MTKLDKRGRINEMENLQKEIARLKYELDELKSTKSLESEEITPREKSIVEYIRRNPGRNKQNLVDWGTSQHIGSRNTILKAIDRLEESGIIEVDKGKPNSTIHRLYINNDSILLLVMEELDGFENVFPDLIEKINSRSKGHDLNGIPYNQNELNFFVTLFVVYQQFIGMLVYHAIHTWPARLKDDNTLKRLYATLFSRLRKIQLNLTCAIKTDKPYNYSIDVSKTVVQLLFVMQPSHIKHLQSMGKAYDAINEVETLLDVVWKVSRTYFRYSMWAHPPPSEVPLKAVPITRYHTKT